MSGDKPAKGLGLGLSALLGEASRPMAPAADAPAEGRGGGVREIEVGRIRPNPNQPRIQFSEESIAELAILGVVLTMFDRRNNLSQAVADDVRACLGPAVFDTVIPRNVRLSEAPSHGLPALIYDLRCAGSEAYLNLARELMARLPQRAEAA